MGGGIKSIILKKKKNLLGKNEKNGMVTEEYDHRCKPD